MCEVQTCTLPRLTDCLPLEHYSHTTTTSVESEPLRVPINKLDLHSSSGFTSANAFTTPPPLPRLLNEDGEADTSFGSLVSSFLSNTSFSSNGDEECDISLSVFVDDCEPLPHQLIPITDQHQIHPSLSFPRPLVGLGILGVLRKDSISPFDGLGVVSVRSTSWSQCRAGSELSYANNWDPFVSRSIEDVREEDGDLSLQTLSYDDSDERDTHFPSRTFLQEALCTLTEDPFHGHVLTSIPECEGEDDESGLAYAVADDQAVSSPENNTDHSTEDRCSALEAKEDRDHFQGRGPARLPRNFSMATISSQLKAQGARARSASEGSSDPTRCWRL